MLYKKFGAVPPTSYLLIYYLFMGKQERLFWQAATRGKASEKSQWILSDYYYLVDLLLMFGYNFFPLAQQRLHKNT